MTDLYSFLSLSNALLKAEAAYDLVLSYSVSRRGSNLFREDDNGVNNWDCLFCFMIVNLHAAYSYKIEAFDK
jgi:hypothetical protein